MLTIHTGDKYSILNEIETTHSFPEATMSPWEQIQWFDENLSNFKEEEVSIKTFSPYILNYLNLKLISGELAPEDIEVSSHYYDEETDETHVFGLKMYDPENNRYLIDASMLSDPMSWMYNKYKEYEQNVRKSNE